ncbi:MAG: DUF6049 family protein [Acidimicrobiales bacterium]
MTALRTVGGAIAALLVVAAVGVWAGGASAEAVSVQASTVELVSQTATVGVGDTFEAQLRFDSVPEDALVEVVLHGRVRSRSELAASLAGAQLRGEIYRATTPLVSLTSAPDGTRRLSLSLDPAVSSAVGLTAAGVYPVEIDVQDVSGEALSSLITHLLVRPASADTSPPLSVAVVADLDASPTLQPDGTRRLPAGQIGRASSIVDAFTGATGVPATLLVRPELLDALAATDDPAGADLLDHLRGAAAGRTVQAVPYVDVSPDALAAAGLSTELDEHLDRGRRVLVDALGVDPRDTTWFAGPDLDEAGLQMLQDRGVRHLVLDPTQVSPLRAGVLALSLAQPFEVRSDATPTVDAFALDSGIVDRLGTTVSSGLEVSRVLAELAMLWFEQPGIARGVVLPIDLSVRGPVAAGLLDALSDGVLFNATGLDDLFAEATPLRQPGGGLVDRPLDPAPPRPISTALARTLTDIRALERSFEGLVGPGTSRSSLVEAHLLLGTAADLKAGVRLAHINAARDVIRGVTGAISAPEHGAITLTARDGTVPLTLRNDSGSPVNVVVRLRSPKLRFPDGDTIAVTLSEATTRLDISVSARASGKFPLEAAVTSPDGALRLATVDYSVQSTAVSGVGLVLSVGAGFFLLIWWARHWRRTRRSGKLVESTHLTTATGAEPTPYADPDGTSSR